MFGSNLAKPLIQIVSGLDAKVNSSEKTVFIKLLVYSLYFLIDFVGKQIDISCMTNKHVIIEKVCV